MNDRRNQIPIGCAVNIAIINELSKTETFSKVCIEIPKKYNIKPPVEGEPWPFFNISWGAYMMYCLFVVSKELYNLSNNDDYFKKLVSIDAMQDFTIHKEKKPFDKSPKYHFSSFRNAISHVHYSVNDNMIHFWDYMPEKGKTDYSPEDWHWSVEIRHPNFMKFLGNVNEANFNLYNEINSGIRNLKGIKKT